MPVVKTLKSARPTVSSATSKVENWNVEVTFKDGSFERDYSYMKDVKDLDKSVEGFTKDELLSFAPSALDEVFANHKLVFSPGYVSPTVTKEIVFDASGHAKVAPINDTVIVAPEKPHTFTGGPK